jgi:hypothetical protein
MDLICYQASIYCEVLVEWCQTFNVCFNVNHPMVGDHEFALITKIHHHPLLISLIVGAHMLFRVYLKSDESISNGFGPIRYKTFHQFCDGQPFDHRFISSKLVTKHHQN